MTDTSTPAIVLGVGHHGDLAIARTLGRLGVAVNVVDAFRDAPAFSSRYCRNRFLWNIDAMPAADSVDFLCSAATRCGARPVLFATSDAGALFIAANQNRLIQSFRFPERPFSLVHKLHNKQEMYCLAKSCGVPVPETFFPSSMDELCSFAQHARFPLILKTIDAQHAKSSALRKKAIVSNKKDLQHQYALAEQNEAQPNVMVQEFIPGAEDANWMFNGYFDADSECLFGITGRKVRQYPPYAGITSLGECIPNPAVAEITRNFMRSIAYRGILDVGFRFDARDGRYKVFDVNARIGCTFRLFVSGTGMDVARAAYLDLTGQRFDPGEAISPRRWMLEDSDLISAIRYWREGRLGLAGWARSIAPVQELAYFATDDFRPMWRRSANNFARVLQKRKSNRPVLKSEAAETTAGNPSYRPEAVGQKVNP